MTDREEAKMVKRYDVFNHPIARILAEERECENGKYVLFSDYQAALAASDADAITWKQRCMQCDLELSKAQAEIAERDKEDKRKGDLFAKKVFESGDLKEEIEELKKSYRELENQYVMQQAIYEGISDLLRDGETSDFMMSFPIVSQIADLLSEISLKQICIDEARRDAEEQLAALKAENEGLRELVDGAMEIVEIANCVSPAQCKWKIDWMQKAQQALKEAGNEVKK
jgi:hypothetical protein